MADDGKQIRPKLPGFPAWVAEQLVGIVENDVTATTRWMAVKWVTENAEWLAAHKITYERYYEERVGGGPRGTVATIKPPSPQKRSRKRGDSDGTLGG